MTVDGELAEAVAALLERFTSGGVVLESDVKYNDAEDEGTPYGPVKVYGYLINDAHVEENRRKLEEGLWHFHTICEVPEPVYTEIADENWMDAWKDHYHPIPIGKKLLILPAWIEQQDMSRVAVKIDPSMAFGTGTHPSTQLSLELIEEYVQTGSPVIDIGCGSGILSIAALKLGASKKRHSRYAEANASSSISLSTVTRALAASHVASASYGRAPMTRSRMPSRLARLRIQPRQAASVFL